MDPTLKRLGWDAFFGECFCECAIDHEPGRVSTVNKSGCEVSIRRKALYAPGSQAGCVRTAFILPLETGWRFFEMIPAPALYRPYYREKVRFPGKIRAG